MSFLQKYIDFNEIEFILFTHIQTVYIMIKMPFMSVMQNGPCGYHSNKKGLIYHGCHSKMA